MSSMGPIALSVRPPLLSWSSICPRWDNSQARQFPVLKLKILPYCIPVSDAQLNSKPIAFRDFSVWQRDGVSQRKGGLRACVVNRSDQASHLLRFPCLLRVLGIFGDATYSTVENFAWNGAASSLMPIQILLHINRGDIFLANSTRFLLHRRDCSHVHISGRLATISVMLYRDYS
jgi:hypothetical protein